MTYNPSIPNATDLISTSQGEIKTNFTQLDTQFGIDHINFKNGGVNGTGFHKKVTFSGVIADPGQTAPISTLYTKLVSGTPQLFFQNGALAANVSQISAGGSVIAYVPTLTAAPTSPSFTGLSITGHYSIVGGVTFFTVNATWTSNTVTSSPTLKVSLPSTATATWGQATLGLLDSASAVVPTALGTISSGNAFASFTNYQLSGALGVGQLLVNGFYS